jgi:hypothetical protein
MIQCREDLDKMGCAFHCEHEIHSKFFLHSRCHPTAPTWVEYTKATGEARVVCSVCKATITTLQIASRQSVALT